MEEIKVQKKRCKELTDKILRRSERVFSGLLHIAGSPNQLDLTLLQKDLETYWMYGMYILVGYSETNSSSRILQEIQEGLAKFTSQNLLQQILDRGIAELDQYNRMIDDFNDDITVCLAVSFIGINLFLQLSLQIETRVGMPSALSVPSLYVYACSHTGHILNLVVNLSLSPS